MKNSNQLTKLKAPFPYFGGKSTVADLVWERFGNVKNYVEPFVGSAAVLLRRPQEHLKQQSCIETINDVDGFVANFWRSISNEETARLVASYADWPVNENDLHARHKWLVGQREMLADKLEDDPHYFEPKIAGWWVWGMCMWIGGGWCPSKVKSSKSKVQSLKHERPNLGYDKGVHRKRVELGIDKGRRRRPILNNQGEGVHRMGRRPALATPTGINKHGEPSRRVPRIDRAMGVGVHKRGKDTGEKDIARHLHLGRSYELQSNRYDVYEDFARLSARLRRVRVVSGDWSRVTSATATHYHNGITGIFLDPPYPHKERDKTLYAYDEDVFEHVWKYAMENGNNPKLRIAVCGYDDGRATPKNWTVHRWKANGGYGRLSKGEKTRGRENAKRELIWFSPHCLNADQGVMFT